MIMTGLVTAVVALLTGLTGWILVKRRLANSPRETFAVVDKTSSDSTFWKAASIYEWGAVPKNYWAGVTEPTKSGPLVAFDWVRVPRWIYVKLFTADSQLQLARRKDGELTHPFYLVRRLLWGFGTTTVVLLINAVSLFVLDEASVPSWLEWTGIN